MAGQQPEAPAVPGVTREQVREMVYAANEEGWWAQGGPASERVTAAIWPLLERAQAAACEPAPVSEGAVDAALAAVAGYQRGAREAVWSFPSRGQVRAMLEGAAAQERSDKEADRG